MADYDTGLAQTAANHQPLTPLLFLERAAQVFPDHIAVVHGAMRGAYRRAARALRAPGPCAGASAASARGDTVAVLLPNIPADAGSALRRADGRRGAQHHQHPARRGDHRAISSTMARRRCCWPTASSCRFVRLALTQAKAQAAGHRGRRCAGTRGGRRDAGSASTTRRCWPKAIRTSPGRCRATSGTPSRSTTPPAPRAIRRAWSTTIAAPILSGGQCALGGDGPAPGLSVDAADVPLQRLVLSLDGDGAWRARMSACARSTPGAIFDADRRARRHAHVRRADRAATLLAHAPAEKRAFCARQVQIMTGGAPPPAAVIGGMEERGLRRDPRLRPDRDATGPSVVNAWHDDWPRALRAEQAALMARQGVRYIALEGLMVVDPETLAAGAARRHDDGRGHDARQHGDEGLPEERDRDRRRPSPAAGSIPATSRCGTRTATSSSRTARRTSSSPAARTFRSIEVEDALYKHPAVAVVAVVARPDEKWGETPCAFVELKPGAAATAEEIIAFCRERLAGFKVPRHIVFAELPKTSTGKIQKHVLRSQVREG